MKVSIITVVWNAEYTIKDAIDSVMSQSYSEIEYIVIDGGSTDGTLEVIESYKDQIDYFISEPDEGIYDAMNKGIGMATGEIIGILNADDFYLGVDVIATVCERFKLTSDVDMVFGNVDFVNPSSLSKVVRFYSSYNFSPWMLRFGLMPAHPASFIKKSAYDLAGLYKLGYKSGADFDMFVRLLLVNELSFSKVNQTIVRMRTGGVSTSGLKSYWVTTQEVVKSLKENNIYSSYFLVLLRLPYKFLLLFKKSKG